MKNTCGFLVQQDIAEINGNKFVQKDMKVNECGTQLAVTPKHLNYTNTLILYRESIDKSGEDVFLLGEPLRYLPAG